MLQYCLGSIGVVLAFETSTPDFISGRKGFDCSTDDKYNSELPNIIKVINEEPLIEIPPVE